MHHTAPKQNGFTLIEVIASFTILAMTFMVILEILSNSSTNTIKSSERTKIALLAQSKMDEVGLLIPVVETADSGTFKAEEVDWDLTIEPFDVPYEGNVEMDFAPVELFRVVLTLSWQDGYDKTRSMDFVTLKAMSPDFEVQGLGQ
ncbi:prepilin-type N-terminal cleavage/methylation domain-containing protein [Marinicella sp. S1101]|uniref:type IV pilus modification PilV family protein n=1 Tax=Marinicella marina TaxID=2996016 RepID=UPI002260E65C|nr:prepilin-type N-terminal cleavage/methylation domain-containing protein [Marinicella marina]MCX7552634.1 prepilin-type N-terminal cleavage/methylation domain-containing protein [Marinicella marina]MDJ1139510.1 prepilin-type N-terminal cleavage/methylation domain-containing protein [Marinicella marina]